MADIRVKDLTEATVPGADYYLLTDSATDGVKKVKTTNVITKAGLGLGNVDNTSDTTKNAAAATLTNKTISGASNTLTVRLGSDVTGTLPESSISFTDITTGNTSTSKHGFAPKLPNDSTKFLDGTGAYSIPYAIVFDITRPPYNCTTGATDNSTGIQSAVNDAIASGGAVRIPKGIFKFSTSISITGTVRIVGEGQGSSILQLTTDPSTGINISTVNAVYLEGFGLSTAISSNTSNGILIDSGSGTQNKFSLLDNLGITNFSNGIILSRAYLWSITRGEFNYCTANSIVVRNIDFPDNGDGVIENCVFSGNGSAPTNHIQQNSGGGLRVMNNKFFYGGIQFYMLLSSGTVTSNLFIQGNSMEASTSAAIKLDSAAYTAGQFRYVLITGNVIDGPGTWNGIFIVSTATKWLIDVSITGNHIGNNEYSPLNGVGAGISIGSGSNYSITGNVLENWSASSGTLGIVLSANVDGAVLVGNTTKNYGVSNAVTNNSVAGTP